VSPSGAIDVHSHFLPESYRTALADNGHSSPDGFPPQVPEWSAEEHMAVMNRLGIAMSLLSVSLPGVYLGDGRATRDRAREVNEAGRRAVVDHPGRFGLFASLPLPDVDVAIAEIAYCYDHVDVSGFVLLTNIGGTYLGDQAFWPVFDELDRRGARLFIHPTSPAYWEHTLAMVADRISVFSLLLDVDPAVDVFRDLDRLHFDVAGFPLPRQLDALLTITSLEHLHYGSDYPFIPEFAVAMGKDRLAQEWDPAGSLLDLLRATTERLFPALLADHQ
jgi:predicted TIM-barrel fold metal-dependent hydrolase